MLEVFINFICAFFLALLGFYIINKMTKNNQKLTLRIIIYLILNSLLIDMIHYMNYPLPALLNFIINTTTYKVIFKTTVVNAILVTGILSLFILLSDIINLIFQMTMLPLYKYQNNLLIYLLSNTIVFIISIIMIKIKVLEKYLQNIYKILSKKDLKLNVIFIILIIIAASGIIYNIITNYKVDYKVLADILFIISLLAILIIFINNKNTYNKLSSEYDVLLSHVSNFEDWIEKEQFTRHEYKNQLAVLYSLSSEKEVKDKIQEIINQNLNIKNEVVNNLKDLPKGGLKGLLYYKTIIAEKKKLKITVDVSIKNHGIIHKLSKKNQNILSKVIGIFYDNAIDAAKESRKKILLLEIYELKDKVNIVISNTFRKSSIIDNCNEKGVSTKGKHHGNGLYYASKILQENIWLESKQEIIDNYFIETITIRKNTSKK